MKIMIIIPIVEVREIKIAINKGKYFLIGIGKVVIFYTSNNLQV